MTDMEQAIAQIAALKAQLAAATVHRALTCKVSEKGAVSVYGLGQWPVTLYSSQWERFIPFIKSGAVEAFILDNAAKLSVKPPKG